MQSSCPELKLFVQEMAQGAQIKIQIGGGETEVVSQFMDFGLQLHQRFPHFFHLLVRKRPPFHPPDGLPLQELPQQLNQAENKLGQALLNVVRPTINSLGKIGLNAGCGIDRAEESPVRLRQLPLLRPR